MAVGSAGMIACTLPNELFAAGNPQVVTILHTNDMHCHIEPFEGENDTYAGKGGLARISGIVQKVKKENPNTLLFDCGDMFQGTPYFNKFKGELMLKTMSKVGYDAGTIGNHEFDNGLQGLLTPLKHAQFPLICSNYDFSETILQGQFLKWKIFKLAGIKIGVYGLGIEFNGLVSEKNYGKAKYLDPINVAQQMEEFLSDKKQCDLVVCLSHLGLEYKNSKVSDMVLASETKKTDLILGGHTHSYMEQPNLVTNKAGKEVVVNQAWWGGLAIGRIDISFENRKKRKTVTDNSING